MPAIAKKRPTNSKGRIIRAVRRHGKVDAAVAIRERGEEWARHWNAGDVEGVAALYAEDAVYLPPHHEAVHGREAIREYLRAPIAHGVSELAFTVTYIKQQGATAWDVGTYRMMIPQNDGTLKEDKGKYLSVWTLRGKNWLLVADAWSSDLSAPR